MPKLVTPRTFLVGASIPDETQLRAYLEHTHQLDFLRHWDAAIAAGIKPAEAMCSVYAKLCYSSLVLGSNANLSGVREIGSNIRATLASGHGSVFEHVTLNFITTGCSRVFTHELVRHRVGTAFSQTSGRYVRTDRIDFVMDPLLKPVEKEIIELLEMIESRRDYIDRKLGIGQEKDFDKRKAMTSALRRILPDGRANEIGWSANVRTLRHLLMLRTSRHAEWEIRTVFCEVFDLVTAKYPQFFADATKELTEDGLFEVKGMVTQPYGG